MFREVSSTECVSAFVYDPAFLLHRQDWVKYGDFVLWCDLLSRLPTYLNSTGTLSIAVFQIWNTDLVNALRVTLTRPVIWHSYSLSGWIKLSPSLSSTQRHLCAVSLSSSITLSLALSLGHAPVALYLWTLNYVIIWDLGIPDLISRTDFTQLITRHS